MTPDQALNNLAIAAARCQGNRDEHIAFDQSIALLRELIKHSAGGQETSNPPEKQ